LYWDCSFDCDYSISCIFSLIWDMLLLLLVFWDVIMRYWLGLDFFIDNDVYDLFCKLWEFTHEAFYDDNFSTDLFLSFNDKLFFFNKLLCDNNSTFLLFFPKINAEIFSFSLYFSLLLAVRHFVSYLLFDFLSSFLVLLLSKSSLLFFLLLQLIELKSMSFYFSSDYLLIINLGCFYFLLLRLRFFVVYYFLTMVKSYFCAACIF